MAKFYQTIFREAFAQKAANDTKLINAAFAEAKRDFDAGPKQELIKKFNEDEVTQEIEKGISAKNISETLPGINEKYGGNLFTFIGFPENSNPTQIVRDMLKNDTQIKKIGRGARYKADRVRYEFDVETPSKEEIENVTPLPWENGRSWVRGIEKGISGLGNYLYSFTRISSPENRSKHGSQREHSVRASSFKTRLYLTKIFNEFKALLAGTK